VSPGPSFVMVARIAIARSRAEGVAAAIGMGAGGVVFTILVLLGLQAAIAATPWLYAALRIGGAAYLMYLGGRIFHAARAPLAEGAEAAAPPPRSAFWRGPWTQLSNPKTAVVYGSVFAALLPRDLPLSHRLALPILVFLLETSWYALVALALSSERPRRAYVKAKVAMDRTAGTVMVGLGGKLLVSAAREWPLRPG